MFARTNLFIMYNRDIVKSIDNQLKRPEVILLFGARRTGKSTLLEMLADKYSNMIILNCEQPEIYDALNEMNIPKIKALFDNNEIVAFDEAQTIHEIGKILKLLYENSPAWRGLLCSHIHRTTPKQYLPVRNKTSDVTQS